MPQQSAVPVNKQCSREATVEETEVHCLRSRPERACPTLPSGMHMETAAAPMRCPLHSVSRPPPWPTKAANLQRPSVASAASVCEHLNCWTQRADAQTIWSSGTARTTAVRVTLVHDRKRVQECRDAGRLRCVLRLPPETSRARRAGHRNRDGTDDNAAVGGEGRASSRELRASRCG